MNETLVSPSLVTEILDSPASVALADGDTRYVAANCHDFCSIAHETRYQWVVNKFDLRGKWTLDFGCGSGYGSYLLAQSAAHVVGIDRSLAAIRYASERFKTRNLVFIAADAAAPSLIDGAFDVIVSFDVIEHVERYFDYLDNARTLLKSDGTLIVGCPNRLQTLRWNRNWNPFHVQEFTPYQLRKILSLYFFNVTLGTQDFRDDQTRESARRSNFGDEFPAANALRQLKRVVPKFARRQISRMRRSASAKRFDHSEIAFLMEPDEVGFQRAFGLVAVCTRPKGLGVGCQP